MTSERDDLRRSPSGAEARTEGAEADRALLDRALAEAAAREAALAELRELRDAERRAMQAELDAERSGRLREAEGRACDEQTWRERIDALHLEFDRDRAALQVAADQRGREAGEAIRGRDDALERAEALDRERGRLADRLAEAEAAHQEAERRLQAEVDRLVHALELARQRTDAMAIERERERAECDQERLSDQRRLDALARELEAARAKPTVEVAHGIDPAEPERRLEEALGQLRAATQRADRLDAELQAARSLVVALNRDLALAQLYGEGDEEDAEPSPEAHNEAIEAARARIEQLNEQLSRANRKNQELQGFLNQLGIRPT